MHTSAPLRSAALTLTLAVVAVSLIGCASTSNCEPAPLQASLEVTAAGAQLTLSAEGVDCDPVVGDTYSFTLTTESGPFALGTALPADDGSFTQTLNVPLGIIDDATGTISVTGSTLDNCSSGAGCPTYDVALPEHEAG